eukprot:TRINITY_DN1494_c0_g1_i5.p1 TRINITY_DN1494_c0_g1~~TRINITY_DN1494_c0_g1_i5.p1  ORF type:complete len:609 (+),score=155.17 TRINITY_DN1494_c0_g1_i5:131-1828(+)
MPLVVIIIVLLFSGIMAIGFISSLSHPTTENEKELPLGILTHEGQERNDKEDGKKGEEYEILDQRYSIRLFELLMQYGNQPKDELDFIGLVEQTVKLLNSVENPKELLWMLHVILFSRYPEDHEVEKEYSRLFIEGGRGVMVHLLQEKKNGRHGESPYANARLKFVSDVMIEVGQAGRNDLMTGIQRVVRGLVSRWHGLGRQLELIIFDDIAARTVSELERIRVLHWDDYQSENIHISEEMKRLPNELVIPWRSTIIAMEITILDSPQKSLRYSGSKLSLVMYDLIPLSRPEYWSDDLPTVFSKYTRFFQQAARIATISKTVRFDAEGFLTILSNQNVAVPEVRDILLPTEGREVSEEQETKVMPQLLGIHEESSSLYFDNEGDPLPLVLSVSSIEPRKNHVKILLAAEKLWEEGLKFQLVFMGGNSWNKQVFDTTLDILKTKGRPVRVFTTVSEELLWSAYRMARFTVFVSQAEGYGLPVGESLYVGTPVVLSNHGSMLEIGEDGGGVEFVNPYDVNSVANGMHRLLTDDARLAQLREEALSRPRTTWDEYAERQWQWLMCGKE